MLHPHAKILGRCLAGFSLSLALLAASLLVDPTSEESLELFRAAFSHEDPNPAERWGPEPDKEELKRRKKDRKVWERWEREL
ncbi:hypothetical protein EDC01DRAFT_777638 [Geopyxis carbonaria]|nr:hypothetical protein EDC01DRAFT_777638 [Geopyxis carbonaria]